MSARSTPRDEAGRSVHFPTLPNLKIEQDECEGEDEDDGVNQAKRFDSTARRISSSEKWFTRIAATTRDPMGSLRHTESKAASGVGDALVEPKPRYDSIQFNALKAVKDREVKHDSLAKMGQEGIHRYDVMVEKKLESTTYHKNDFYMKTLRDKRGTTNFTATPLFMVKGLHNYSNLPSGDARIFRATSTAAEQYIHPEDRAPVPAKFAHLQAHEVWDRDLSLGPTAPSGFGPLTSAPPGIEDKLARNERTAIYRECIENVKPSKLEALESMFREKLNMYAAGSKSGSAGYQIKNTFRYLDRDANGVVDMENFCKSLEFMGIDTDDTSAVALFAKYDVQRRGFVDYQEFVKYIIGSDYFGKTETAHIAAKIQSLCNYLRRNNGNFEGLKPAPIGLFRMSKTESIHALSDEEFMERQRIRAIFQNLDIDGSGFLNVKEYTRMTRLLGCVLNVKEAAAIFEHIDSDHSGEISFDEFFNFYHAEIPEN